MMDDSRKPSNEHDADASARLLSALLDGELSGPERSEVLERLQANQEDAERFAHYRAQRAALQALFPLPGAAPVLFVQRRASWRRAVAAGLGGLAAGLLLGLALHAEWTTFSGTPAFAARADVAYAVYAIDRQHPVEIGASEPERLAAWLSERVGQPVRAPSLAEYGYKLIGGRLLPGVSGPAAQFMYQRADGERVTLYATVFGGRSVAPRALVADGRRTYFWSDRGMGYALSGRGSEPRLREIAMEACGALGGSTNAWKG
ncbi:anti-sigma factor family protein [Burkholderia ubonensis]|uniref:anti-sigma factor family protein n=1 Tax=Burkholderia ubonensis TaxID=101571 RepID=UPI0009B3F483|nr:anti-sigma factor [Burkholderia ubonensis]